MRDNSNEINENNNYKPTQKYSKNYIQYDPKYDFERLHEISFQYI